jgi:hypothetical protein
MYGLLEKMINNLTTIGHLQKKRTFRKKNLKKRRTNNVRVRTPKKKTQWEKYVVSIHLEEASTR